MPDSGERMPEYRTDELALAATLAVRGHTHQRLEKRGTKAVWVFHQVEDLLDEVNLYHDGCAEVEPVAFAGRMAALRNEMYAFMKMGRYAK